MTKESGDAAGDKSKSDETYSVDVPGTARDNSLHLVQRVTTTQRTNSSGQQTTEVAEQPDAGDPGAGLRVSTVNTDTVRLVISGAQSTRTIQIRDGSGSLGVVSVDMTKSNSAPSIDVQIAPSKPK